MFQKVAWTFRLRHKVMFNLWKSISTHICQGWIILLKSSPNFFVCSFEKSIISLSIWGFRQRFYGKLTKNGCDKRTLCVTVNTIHQMEERLILISNNDCINAVWLNISKWISYNVRIYAIYLHVEKGESISENDEKFPYFSSVIERNHL